MQNVMARAWEMYRVARPARWASGDETGVRRFLPDLFRNLLGTAWKEARQQQWRDAQHQAEQIARDLVEKLRQTNVDIARRMDPEVRATRIRGIAYELDLLTFSSFGTRASQRSADLRQEMEILQEACRLEDECSEPRGIGKTAALAIALANVSFDHEARAAVEGEQIARVA